MFPALLPLPILKQRARLISHSVQVHPNQSRLQIRCPHLYSLPTCTLLHRSGRTALRRQTHLHPQVSFF
ncbi:unnamed protein product, partial [Nesidiocoris tenuis]